MELNTPLKSKKEALQQALRYVPYGVCLLLCIWLCVDSALQISFGPTRLLSLFAALVIASLSLLLLGLRATQWSACTMALYLMALGVLARDNIAGLNTIKLFSTESDRLQNIGFQPVHLVWITVLGMAPLLFTYLYTAEEESERPHIVRILKAAVVVMALAFVQALFVYLVWHGDLSMIALTTLAQPLRFPQHRLLIYAAPVVMLQQLFALWILWRHYRRWGEGRNRALLLAFGVAALFVALCVINNSVMLPVTGILSNLCAYLVPTAFVWAIERYALFNIKITVRRVVRYAMARQILAIVTLGPLLSMTFLLGFYFNPTRIGSGALRGSSRFWEAFEQGVLPCLLLFGLFAVIMSLRIPLLRWLDRAYFREVYNAQETLNRIGRSLVGLSDSREIARRALEGIDGVLHPMNAFLIATEEEGILCIGQHSRTGYRPAARPDASLLGVDRVQEIAPSGVGAMARATWVSSLSILARTLIEGAGIRLILPLREEDRTTGVLLLGEKASGVEYTSEDVEVLLALMSQIALALQSARLNREFLRRGTQELTERSADFIAEVERERRLLAADLHDQTLPELRALLADLQTLEEHQEGRTTTLQTPPPPISEGQDIRNPETPTPGAMAEHLRTTIANIRDMMESLRPSALEMLGLLPALESELRKSAARSRPPIVPQFQASTEAEAHRLSAFEEVSVFRIMQEGVNNACRHASAKRVRVEVGVEDDHWVLSVEDDGKGLPPEDGRHRGHGLDNMRYRAGLIHAKVSWSTPEGGQGTRMELRLPLRRSTLSTRSSA